MATISNETTLGVPGTPDAGSIQQDELQVNGQTINRLTNRYTDYDSTDTTGVLIDNGGLILEAELTTQDIELFVNSLSTNNTNITAATTAAADFTDGGLHILYTVVGAQINPDLQGVWNLTNYRVLRRTAGNIYIFGNASESGLWRANINGLTLESYGGNLTFHTGGLDVDNSTINGVLLVGNATGQFNARSAQFGFTAANVSDQQAMGPYENDFGYSIRFVHQLLPLANVNATSADALLPQEYALYTNPDLRNIVSAGADFSSIANTQPTFQMNRRAAPWLINPNFGNHTGEVNAGRTMALSFHSGNFPGSTNGGGTTAQNLSELRVFIADRPTFQDAAGTDVAGTKVRYGATAHPIPAAYARGTPPVPYTLAETTVDSSAHRGSMVQSQRIHLSRTVLANRDPADADNQVAALRTDITRTVRNFRYDYPYEANVVYDPNTMTGLLEATPARNEGVDLQEFLNNRNASSDLLNGISDFADEYAALRAYWYDAASARNALPGEMPVTAAGTALTYNRNVNYQTTGSVEFTSTAAQVVSNTEPTLSGLITDRIYGTNTVSWNTVRFPDNIGISGGSHNGFGSLTGRSWRALADLTLVFPSTLTGTVSFAAAFGNVTITDGITFTVASDATLTINATADEIAMFTVNNGLGLGTLTFNEVVAPVNFEVRVQQSAVFGGVDRDFDGYITIVENASGTRTIPSDGGPFLIGAGNRDSILYTTDSNTIPDGTTIEVYTTGRQWNVARTTFTNATTNGAITAPVIADILYESGITSPTTVTDVTFNSADNTINVETDVGGLLTEGNGNATAGQIRQFIAYAQAIGLRGLTQDIVFFQSDNSIAPTFNPDVLTGSTPADNNAITWQGGGTTLGSTGNLGVQDTVTVRVWTTSAGAAGAQPAAIGAVVRQSIDDANVATRQDVIDNTEPLLQEDYKCQ